MDTQVKPAADTDRIRLLLVDDDVNLLETLSRLLYRRGYIVTPATGGNEALAILRENHKTFDIVLTDYSMPIINGFELALMIWELLPDIPIILHTGKIDLVDERQIAKAGVAEIIIKPYKVNDLDKIIKKVIGETEGKNRD